MNNNTVKRLNDKIKQIKNKELYLNIYKIAKNDSNFKATFNNNGIYFNINSLDDITLIKIENLINNYTPTDDKNKLSYTSYYNETEEEKLNKKLITLNLF